MLDKDGSGIRTAGIADPWSRGWCAKASAETVHGEKQMLVWSGEGYKPGTAGSRSLCPTTSLAFHLYVKKQSRFCENKHLGRDFCWEKHFYDRNNL